jgi:hypothetical protein
VALLVLAFVVWLLSGVHVVAAQTVSGTVTGPDQRPVSGIVVELLDATSAPVAHTVVGNAGTFSLRARSAGRYRVRARQVGWRPVLSAPLDLRAGEEATVRLAFVGAPMSLDTVRVTNRNVCGVADDSTAAVVAALEYARTALLGTDIRRPRGLTFAALRFDQILDPVRERVVQQRTRLQTDSAAQPWASSSIESLQRDGYVITTAGDSVIYRLPGLDMLASTAFVNDHCFQFNGKSDQRRIGINFEPAPTRKKLADIKGTIWLDRTTAALTSLDFRFTNLEGAQDDAKPGGQMSFTRLSDGTWAVTQWAVRMPILERRAPKAIGGARIGSGVPETVVANISVSGGQISAVLQAGDTLFARPGIVVSGVVVDSASNKPLTGARIELLGTAVRGISEDNGKFALSGVLPGEYVLAVRTASLDSVRTASTFPLTVLSAAPGTQTLRIANAASVVALICPPSRTASLADRGVLVGLVSSDVTDDANAARVTIEWPADPNATAGATRWIATRSGADGIFRACGVPTERPITVRAWSARAASAPVTTSISTSTRFAGVELALDSTRVESGVFVGAVVANVAGDSASGGGKPIADAEVSVPALNRTVRTNADGLFQISDLPSGTHRILVRKLGYGPLDVSLAFAPRERVERRIVLGTVSVLSTVDVKAKRLDPGMRDFEEQRALGIGRFLTRDDLERQRMTRMTEVLMMVNGIRFKPLANRQYASAGHRPPVGMGHCYYFEGPHADSARTCVPVNECFMQVYLDNHPLFLGRDGETVPDLSRFRPDEIEAVEVYASGAETPSKYSGLGTSCGSIVLHRRR